MERKCRVLVHYHFKKGQEQKGAKILEEIILPALMRKTLGVDLYQSADDATHFYFAAGYNNLEDAHSDQRLWEEKEFEILQLCINVPKREYFKLFSSHRRGVRAA